MSKEIHHTLRKRWRVWWRELQRNQGISLTFQQLKPALLLCCYKFREQRRNKCKVSIWIFMGFSFVMNSLTPRYSRRAQRNYRSSPSRSKYLNTLTWISGQLWCSLQIRRGLFGTPDQELNSGMIEGMQFEKVSGEGWIAPHGRRLKKCQRLVTDSMGVGRVTERHHSCRSKTTRCWRGWSVELPSRCR